MSLNKPLLMSSLEVVASREPVITERFYGILFERYPQVRPLFGGNDPKHQAAMLQEAIVAVVDHAEDAEWLHDTLHGMGRKHIDYGVTAEMYPWVGECLLETLRQIAADDWNAEIEEAWADAYGAISALMLEGAAGGEAAE
jgi:hemoglobin-like flavoprotein